MEKLIIFIDGGDTLFDEGSQTFSTDGDVVSATCLPNASEILQTLVETDHKICLVADGRVRSFHNVLTQNNLLEYFSALVISEEVGSEKPSKKMFTTALTKLQLTNVDKYRIVMIGNNLSRDILGANQFGIISIWFNWSPRYSKEITSSEEQPNYIISSLSELLPLIESLEQQL